MKQMDRIRWIRSADPRACAIRALLYLWFCIFGIYLVIASPGVSAYGIVLIGMLGIAINIAAVIKSN